MNWRKHTAEAVTIVVAAVICALVANAFASRERKLVVISHYSAPASRPVVMPIAQPTETAAAQTNIAPPRTAAPPPNVPAPTPSPATTTRQPDNPATAARQPANPAPAQPTTDNRQPITRFPPHPDKAFVEIHYSDVAWLHAKGVLFLDARRSSVYDDGHIAGARSMPVWESDIDDRVNKLYAERPDPAQQNQPIVAYCSGGDCEDSHMLAQKLWGIQFNNVYVYKDGFPDWQAHGGAIDKGANP